MPNLNKVFLMGNVTRDPELRYIQSGTAVLDLGLAVNRRTKSADGSWTDETTFVDVTVWGRHLARSRRRQTKNRARRANTGRRGNRRSQRRRRGSRPGRSRRPGSARRPARSPNSRARAGRRPA